MISTLPVSEAQELMQQCMGFRSSSTQIMTLLGTPTVLALMMNSTFRPSPCSLLRHIFLSILSYGRALPSGVFVPVILTGAAYGRLVSMLTGSQSTLDHGLFVVLGLLLSFRPLLVIFPYSMLLQTTKLWT
jgi:H+/Cl- antiporter ClcA